MLVGVRVEPGIEDLDDVLVDQAGRGERLALKARHECGIVGEVLGEQLDGDESLESLVEGEVDS